MRRHKGQGLRDVSSSSKKKKTKTLGTIKNTCVDVATPAPLDCPVKPVRNYL